jgi:vesicular inhibitory amino acid transporter
LQVKLAVEVLLLVHLVSAYPMFMNPPNQFIEELLGIPASKFRLKTLTFLLLTVLAFNVKRTVFRSLVVAVLLFLAESLPSFSAILQLVSSIFVTCLTFIFPPLFYMRLVAKSSDNKIWEQRSLGIFERIMCYQAIIIGLFGGVLSFISSIKYIQESSYVPCYMQEMARSC